MHLSQTSGGLVNDQHTAALAEPQPPAGPALQLAALAVLDDLDAPLRLRCMLAPGHPAPGGVRALLAAAAHHPRLELLEVGAAATAGAAWIEVSGPAGSVRFGPSAWAMSDDGLLFRALPAVLPAEACGGLLQRLAFVGATLSTLQTITTYMLGTYDEVKALHIMLSGVTAGYSLGFNRAAFFRHDPDAAQLVGELAIGPASGAEAHRIWEGIEASGGGIERLVDEYDPDRYDTELQALVRSIAVPLGQVGGELREALAAAGPICLHRDTFETPELRPLGTNGHFVLAPVRAHERLIGVLFADDRFQPGAIAPSRVRQLGFFVDQTALICENLGLLATERERARLDPLTGVLNRRELDRQLDLSVERALRLQERLAVMLLDVDQFKEVNDQRGHAEGDRILRGVARAVESLVRGDDMAGRYGGDEFVVVLAGASARAAARVAGRIRRRVAQRLGATLSIGGATLPDDGATPAALLAAADRRLYQAKGAGRDQYVG